MAWSESDPRPDLSRFDASSIEDFGCHPSTLIEFILLKLDCRRQNPPLREIQLAERTSNIGSLDNLPKELVGSVLENLDFQSLLNFAKTSFRAMRFVQSIPAFVQIQQHVPNLPADLASAKVLHRHSIASIHKALRSPACETCLAFGGYLELTACIRACRACLFNNPSLQGLNQEELKVLFDIELDETSLPVITWTKHHEYREPVTERLTTAAWVMDLLEKKYGSQELAIEEAKKRCPRREQEMLDFLKDASTNFEKTDPFARPPGWEGYSRAAGTSAGRNIVEVPYLRPDGAVDIGLGCKACRDTNRRFFELSDVPRALRRIYVPDSWRDDDEAFEQSWRSHVCVPRFTKEGLRRHIESCPGVWWQLGPQGDYTWWLRQP